MRSALTRLTRFRFRFRLAGSQEPLPLYPDRAAAARGLRPAAGGAYAGCPMPVQPPWTLDMETIVGVTITLLAMLAVQVAPRLRARRRQRSNRHHRGGRSLRLVGGLHWGDAAVDGRNGGAVGTHGQGGAGKSGRGAVDPPVTLKTAPPLRICWLWREGEWFVALGAGDGSGKSGQDAQRSESPTSSARHWNCTMGNSVAAPPSRTRPWRRC